MAKIRFKIIGAPVAKGRPRFARRGNFVTTYTPENTRTWEAFVKDQSNRHRPEKLWEGALLMTLVFYMPRPKSLPKKVIHHIKKPDLDNLAKSIKDALQGIIYRTDSQIVELNLRKIYGTCEHGVVVDIEEVE